jgi:hypothetical protein
MVLSRVPPRICSSYDAISTPNHLHIISTLSPGSWPILYANTGLETTRIVTNHHANHRLNTCALPNGYIQHAIRALCQHVDGHWTMEISNTGLASGIERWHHRHRDAE